MNSTAMKTAASLLFFLSFSLSSHAAQKECVVLLHGLGRTSFSMKKLERALEKNGYIAWNKSYPSREKTIEELAQTVGAGIGHCRKEKASKIHFVTHSLGGILVRQYFQDHRVPEAHRAVMLGPPNHGSEIVDRNRDAWWFQKAMGPAGRQLGTGPDSLPNRLIPVALEIGIIAGTDGGSMFARDFHDENDGKVSVESAKLAGMKDFLVVDTGHTFIMNSGEVIGQVLHFLRQGRFDHPAPASAPATTIPAGPPANR